MPGGNRGIRLTCLQGSKVGGCLLLGNRSVTKRVSVLIRCSFRCAAPPAPLRVGAVKRMSEAVQDMTGGFVLRLERIGCSPRILFSSFI